MSESRIAYGTRPTADRARIALQSVGAEISRLENMNRELIKALERIAQGNPAPRGGKWLTDIEMAQIARDALEQARGEA